MKFGEVVVGLNTDEFIEKYKGQKPIMTYTERKISLHAFFPELEIIPNGQENDSILDLVDYVNPHIIIIGSDWLRKDYLKQIGVTADDLDKRDIALCYVKYSWEISSTEIKRRIREL